MKEDYLLKWLGEVIFTEKISSHNLVKRSFHPPEECSFTQEFSSHNLVKRSFHPQNSAPYPTKSPFR